MAATRGFEYATWPPPNRQKKPAVGTAGELKQGIIQGNTYSDSRQQG